MPQKHLATTISITVVHPISYDPQEVADIVSDLVGNRGPDSWGFGSARPSDSVEVVMLDDEDGDEFAVPAWHARNPEKEDDRGPVPR